MVDQSLLRQAADRGVTICFADLDGADGLWVPEERTVLVNRGLSEAKATEVIEHELAHVMIDDQHADLDAGKEVLAGHPPSRSRRSETVALAAAFGLVAILGGVVYGINATRTEVKDRVAPNNGPGLTAQEPGQTRNLAPNVVVRRDQNGDILYVTLTPTPGAPAPTASATASPTASATTPVRSSGPAPSSTVAPPAPSQTTPAAPPPPSDTAEPPPTTTQPPDPTTPPPTTAPGESAGGVGDTGDQGGGGGTSPGVTQPATAANPSAANPSAADASVADASVADAPVDEAPSDLVPVDGTAGP